jgi:hypothetical protein
MNRIGQVVILTSVLGVATAARADEAADAFAKGKAALKANKIKEACDAFAESEKLHAAVETELELARCLEKDGKLVAAAKQYRLAADKDADKKRVWMEKASKLEARAPKLRFAINPNPSGLVIKVDGVAVATVGDALVDIGPHEVIATAPGYAGRANAPVDREGQILDVILRLEAVEAPKAEPAPEPRKPPEAPVAAPMQPDDDDAAPDVMEDRPEPTEARSSNRRRNGLIVGGVGVATLIGAGILFGVGSDLQSDSDGICPNSMCRNTADLTKASDYRDDGRLYRGIGIGVGIGGAVMLAAGVIMFATAPKESATPVSLRVDANGGSVAYTFGF